MWGQEESGPPAAATKPNSGAGFFMTSLANGEQQQECGHASFLCSALSKLLGVRNRFPESWVHGVLRRVVFSSLDSEILKAQEKAQWAWLPSALRTHSVPQDHHTSKVSELFPGRQFIYFSLFMNLK